MFPYLSWFFIPIDPKATLHGHLTVTTIKIYALPSQFFLNIFNQSNPHLSWRSTDRFDAVFLEEIVVRDLWDSVYKVDSGIQQCPMSSHSLTNHSLTHSELLGLKTPFMISALIDVPFLFYTVFLLYIFCV